MTEEAKLQETPRNTSNIGRVIISRGAKAVSKLLRGPRDFRSEVYGSEGGTIFIRIAKVLTQFLVLGVFALTLFVLLAPHFGFAFLEVTSGSMEPALPVGSIVIFQNVASSQINVGDIVAYRTGSGQGPVVTHRVSEVLHLDGVVSFQTWGDAYKQPYVSSVPLSSVVGKAKFHMPLVGFILSFIRQPLGYGLLIGLPAFAIIIVEFKSLAGQIGALKRKKEQKVI
jgi:signal peptidase